MKKLIVSILLFSFSLLAGAQQYEYKINARTGKPDMVTKAQNIDLSNYLTNSDLSTALSGYASISSLGNYATVSSLGNYATTSSLSNYMPINNPSASLYWDYSGGNAIYLRNPYDNIQQFFSKSVYALYNTPAKRNIEFSTDATRDALVWLNYNTAQDYSEPRFITAYKNSSLVFKVESNGAVYSLSGYYANNIAGLTATRTFNEQSANNLQYRVNTVTITGGIITAWTQGTWTNH